MTLRHSSKRHGFSLIELLVVIAIISLLAALIVGATMRVIGVQMQKNTQMLLQKLQPALTAQWQATIDQAQNEKIPDANYPAILAQAGNDPQGARVVWIKLRLAQQFPTSFAQAMSPDGGLGLIAAEPAYARVLNGVGTIGSPTPEQGVLLYLVLKNSRRGAAFDPDTLSPRELATMAVGSPNNITRCFIDDWKGPLQYSGYNGPFDATTPIPTSLWIMSTGGPSSTPIYSNQLLVGQ